MVASSKHDPIEHFITWEKGLGDVRFYRTISGLIGSLGLIPSTPGSGTIRYFHANGYIDITEPFQAYCQQHQDVIEGMITRPAIWTPNQRAAGRKQFTAAVQQMLDNPDTAHTSPE